MTELEQLRAENRQLKLRARGVMNVAVALLENGAARPDVVRHLEDGVADLLPPVAEKAGQPS